MPIPAAATCPSVVVGVSRPSDPGGARTHDLLIKSQLLCQLSYRVALKIGADVES